MLAATQVPARRVEHRVFAARSPADWDHLAAERSTADDRAVFVLAEPRAPAGEGLLWCTLRSAGAVADLGWWWIHRPYEGTPAERELFEQAAAWAATSGATRLVSAADDHREQASLVRAGFVHHGIASDGHRPVLTRRVDAPALVD